MAENYSHWRNLTDTTHLRAELFQPGEEKVLTIKEIVGEEIVNNTGQTSNKPVAYFEENVLPMVLNSTNCKTIEKIYNTGNIFEWVGKKIQVFATKTKVAGEMQLCLRVRNFEPKSGKVEYKCSVCGKNIDEKTYKGSVEKYGQAFCSKECLDKNKNGGNVL